MNSMHQDILKVLVTEQQLQEKIQEIGAQITADYQGKNLLLISVLKGSVIFMADLIRSIDTYCQIDFMNVSSYGNQTTSSGTVKIIKDLDINITGFDVLIVEDILDSGRTLAFIKKLLEERKPNSMRICTLLHKPERQQVSEASPDYTGFVIPDEFIVGYGLDYAERYRNLPYLAVLKEAVYRQADQ